MSEEKYNELDKLFRSRLGDTDPDPAEWNTPSADVFNKAMSRIGRNRKRRRFPFLWILVVLLFMTLSGIVFYQYQSMQQMRSDLQELEDRMADQQSGKEQNTLDHTVRNELEEISFSAQKSKISPIQPTNSKYREKLPEADAPPLSSKNHTKGVFSKPDLVKDHFQSQLPAVDKVPGFAADPSPGISEPFPIHPITTLPQQAESAPIELFALDIKDPSMDRQLDQKLMPFISVGPAFSTFRMTDLPGTDFSLKEYDRFYTGVAIAGGLRHQLSDRWSLEYEVSLHRQINKSRFEESVSYDKNRESFGPSGNTIYQTDVRIVSPIGSVQRQLTMDVSGNAIDDKAPLTHTTDIVMNFTSIGLGVTPRYTFLNSSNLKLSTGIGPRLFYLAEFRKEMALDLAFNATSIKSESFEPRDPMMVKTFYGGLYGDIELTIPVTKSSFVQMQTGYYRSLTSLKTTSGPDPSQTFLNALYVDLGVQVRL